MMAAEALFLVHINVLNRNRIDLELFEENCLKAAKKTFIFVYKIKTLKKKRDFKLFLRTCLKSAKKSFIFIYKSKVLKKKPEAIFSARKTYFK